LTEIILSILEHGTAGAIDTAWATFVPNPDSYKRLRFLILNDQAETHGKRIARKARVELEEFHKYRVVLSRLKKQGLIRRENKKEGKVWKLTTLGLNKLRKTESNPRYMKLVDEPGVTIISYDIPESIKKKRERLREILKMADFKQLHKSLWYGEKKVTKIFLKTLKDLQVLDHTHIFEVSKSGTVQFLVKRAE